jgi:hypothetical protein
MSFAKQIAYSSQETLDFSYAMGAKYKDADGVYVECGVAAGAQVIAMAAGAPDKIIYAFDSFEGIPLPSNRDDQMPGIRKLKEWEQKSLPDAGKQLLETSGATVVTVAQFMENLQIVGIPESNIMVVPGWFENTVPDYAEGMPEISILRLDGDLYNSTWVCLQYLFEKVIHGGCVIIDDWTLVGCRDACKEYFALIGYEPEYKFISTIAYFFK